jgi:DNA-binding response OmpR family regulator
MTTNARILVVEDQPSVRALLEQMLVMSGYEVVTASDGMDALRLLETENVDLIIADIMMPNMDGYQLYERVMENPLWVRIPFIYLTARLLDQDIRYGKELGVDDYLIKPVEARDLLAVVTGKLRRARRLEQTAPQIRHRPTAEPGMLSIGELKLEQGQYRAWLAGEALNLSNTEFLLLECLAQNVRMVVPMTNLIQITHGLDALYGEASDLLRPMVRSIRRKMGCQAGDMGYIESVRGVGYRLVPPKDDEASSEQGV